MKKTVLIMGICLPLLFAAGTTVNATTSDLQPVGHVSHVADWKKSKTGVWEGMQDGKTYWYKLDDKAKLWWSADGKKWAMVKGGMWADKEGRWMKIHEGKLVWSTDGKKWAEVPDWKWEGSDGKWYKFDSDWTLWVNS